MNTGRAWETLIAVLLASAGGLARLLTKRGSSKMKAGRLLSELFISGFSGLMVLLLARALFGLSGDWVGLVSGMAGWVGPRILDLVATPAGKAVGLDIDKDTK